MHPAAAACMAICAVMLLSTIPGHALAQRHGVVYVDDNGNGRRDAGELGREGVALSNGRDVVLTGSGGSYELPALPGGDGRARFVSLSCPADARCPTRFHRLEGDDSGSRDFALLPAEREDDLFFVHWSDVHAYPVPEDLARAFNADSLPWWLPNFVIGWGFLNMLDEMNPQHSADEIVEVLRAAVAPHRDVEDAWGPTVVMAYFDAALDPSTGLIDPGGEIPAAMAEVAALRPAFVISTGT